MAKFIEIKIPTEQTYVFEFTQSEMNVLSALVCDLANRDRNVVIDYRSDGSPVVPTALGLAQLKSMAAAMDFIYSTTEDDYDYFDWWDVADAKS